MISKHLLLAFSWAEFKKNKTLHSTTITKKSNTMTKTFFTLTLLLFSICGFSLTAQSILENPKALKSALLQNNVWPKKIFVGYSKLKNPIYAYFYNRSGTDNAMIIGGVHGSEFYGVDVVHAIKDSLDKMKNQKFKWRVLLIAELFPVNVKKGRQNIFKENYGRKTCDICNGQKEENECINHCVDPNRQMPGIDSLYRNGKTTTAQNGPIEIENQYLLFITQTFNPSRIVSVHCKNGVAEWMTDEEKQEHESKNRQIGIFADPRTITIYHDTLNNNQKKHRPKNIALNYHIDEMLTLKMAFLVKENKGIITGNFIDKKYVRTIDEKTKEPAYNLIDVSYLNTIYPLDEAAADEGSPQIRSFEKNGGKVSFGTWASTRIKEKKDAIMLTIELPQYYSFFSKKNDLSTLDIPKLKANTNAYVNAIAKVFLEN